MPVLVGKLQSWGGISERRSPARAAAKNMSYNVMSRNFGNFLGMATAGPFILTWRVHPFCYSAIVTYHDIIP